MAEVLLNQKITTRVLLMSSPFYIVNLPVLPFCMGYPEEMLSFARHTNLCIHNSERYMFLWVVPLFSCILISVYHLIVKSMSCIHAHRYLIFLWSVKPFYSGMTRRNKLQYLVHFEDWVKVVVFRGSKCQSSLCSILPWSVTIFMSRMSWELHHLLWILDAVILLSIINHSSVPCCCNRNADKWTVMCEINTPSNFVAW
jgi:hypothetical protein